jgi:hypothetical protein
MQEEQNTPNNLLFVMIANFVFGRKGKNPWKIAIRLNYGSI